MTVDIAKGDEAQALAEPVIGKDEPQVAEAFLSGGFALMPLRFWTKGFSRKVAVSKTPRIWQDGVTG